MLVDSHCHLDRLELTPYDGRLAGALEKAHAAGISHMLCVCIDMENFPVIVRIAEQYPNISLSVGVHPNERDGHEPDVEELVALAAHPKVVAIGETGLDFFRSEGDVEWQRQRFRQHIRAARLCGKPLIVHMRDATEDTLLLLAEEGAAEVGGVMHCFVEDFEVAERAMAMNFSISISGIVTFNSAKTVKEVARRVPLDRLLLETDSPYLAPVPHRGRPNEPAYTREVAECVAMLRGMSVDQLAEATSHNFRQLFKVN